MGPTILSTEQFRANCRSVLVLFKKNGKNIFETWPKIKDLSSVEHIADSRHACKNFLISGFERIKKALPI